MSRWQDILDQQIDLYRFWRGPHGESTAHSFRRDMGTGTDDNALMLPGIEAGKMFLADPFYVEPDMWTLIEAAAGLFKPEPLQESDMLTRYGFVVLPHPFTMVDRHDKRISFRAFAWGPLQIISEKGGEVTGTGVHLSLYTHFDDAVNPAVDDYHDSLTLEEIQEVRRRMGTEWSLAHYVPWVYGAELPGDPGMLRYTTGWWQPVQAFLRLTMQTLGERYQQKPPRAARKRAERVLKRNEDRYITVIRLRRPRGHSENEPGGAVDWQQRWIVNGHWRNAWYPSLNLHRQVWISPYVKGPDDKPLLIRKGRAFEFVR